MVCVTAVKMHPSAIPAMDPKVPMMIDFERKIAITMCFLAPKACSVPISWRFKSNSDIIHRESRAAIVKNPKLETAN